MILLRIIINLLRYTKLRNHNVNTKMCFGLEIMAGCLTMFKTRASVVRAGLTLQLKPWKPPLLYIQVLLSNFRFNTSWIVWLMLALVDWLQQYLVGQSIIQYQNEIIIANMMESVVLVPHLLIVLGSLLLSFKKLIKQKKLWLMRCISSQFRELSKQIAQILYTIVVVWFLVKIVGTQ